MQGKVWHDANLPGFSSGKTVTKEKSKVVTGVDDYDSSDDKQEPEKEVRIIDGKWAPGPKGYLYNESCYLDVSTEYLPLKNDRKTIRKRIFGKLYGIYDGEEVDMGENVEGHIDDKTNTARLTIKKLWYVNNPHYSAWQKDKSVKVQYIVKEISHTLGANKINSPKLELPIENEDPDRWIIFEETAEHIEPDFTYELSKAQSPKNRWIYAFGTTDGKTFSKVWEIRTGSAGKQYATLEIDEGSYAERPDHEQYEDVAFLPALIDGIKVQIYACISDVRLSKERIFNKENGLFSDPLKRCSNIDDNKQAVKNVLSGGEEKIVILNPLLHAESLRKRFGDVYEKWEESRHSSWLAKSEDKKKEKLIYEFGAILLRIFEAIPEYKKHLASGEYPKIYESVEASDKEKERITTEITEKLDKLCRFISSQLFTETCIDYTCLIRKDNDQPQAISDFEDRVGNLIEHLSRFPQGSDTIRNLLPKVKSQKEHSWLQDLILLKNDLWDTNADQQVSDSKPAASGGKQFQNLRKLGDGLVKLFIEGAKSGAGTYKPEEMVCILNKVVKTTGESFKFMIEHVNESRNGVLPFQKVLGSFDKNSFWRIKIEQEQYFGKDSGRDIFSKTLKSDTVKNLLKGLEGIAMLYSIKDHIEKTNSGKADGLDQAAFTLKLLTYFVKNELIKVPYKGEFVKIGGGPIAVANCIMSAYDGYVAFIDGNKQISAKDFDAGIWNKISAVGNFTSAVGYGALAATFFAGAALSSSTIVGIAPGTILAVMGIMISIGGKIMVTQTTNTAMENQILLTSWGIAPVKKLNEISYSELNQQYCKILRIINSFIISINHDSQTAILHLKRLEPETKITIHEITYGVPSSADGSTSDTSVIGTNITLTENNCSFIKKEQNSGVDIQINIAELCPMSEYFVNQRNYVRQFGKQSKPDYIKLIVSIDIYGDGKMVLPDVNKKTLAEKYYDQQVIIKTV